MLLGSNMTPPRISPVPRMIQLKQSVDLQLDHAFHEGQWTVVANLARQRHKSTKDEYYKAVEIAAKSRSDNPLDRVVGEDVVQTMIAENTTIKDADALDLYEFALYGLPTDYSKTIGVLRARLVKALPKDKPNGIKCLEACLWYSDWENAQEIAASLSKNFPGDRKLLFQNIITTYLVAASENVSEVKKKLFPSLVKAQADRAFNLRPTAGQNETSLVQQEIDQNELLLWLQIHERFGSPQEILKLLTLPHWGPLFFLERGLTDGFLRSLRLLSLSRHVDEVLRITNIIFDKVISLGKDGPNPEQPPSSNGPVLTPKPSHQDDTINDQYMNASREWALWVLAMDAASDLPNSPKTLKALRKKIDKVVSVLRNHRRMPPVFERNYDQTMLTIRFARNSLSSGSEGVRAKNVDNVRNLISLTHKFLHDSTVFSMILPFLGALDKQEIVLFVSLLGTQPIGVVKDLGSFDDFLLIALRLRVKLFEATSLKAGEECHFCQSVAKGTDCEECLKKIAKLALDSFSRGVTDETVLQMIPNQIEDPLSNFVVLGSICLLKLAGAGRRNWQYKQESPLYNTDLQMFLQALVWVDFYVRKTPKNDALRLLLVKMYLMMGCVTRALQVWSNFDVKNTLLECLGSLSLDRLASISPSHFLPGSSHHTNFAEAFLRHFQSATQKRYPDTLIKSLHHGSYSQLSHLVTLVRDQSRNCALVMAVVENRRGLRYKSGRSESPIEEDPLIGSISPDYQFEDLTDYTPLPNWGSPYSTSTQELVSYGPLPTNRRCHLSILAERFMDFVCYVPPKDFKPLKVNPVLQADWVAGSLTCKTLFANLNHYFHGEDYKEARNDFTNPECWYFCVVTELARFVKLLFDHVLLKPSTKATSAEIVNVAARVLKVLEYQTQDFLSVPDGIPAKMHTLHGVAALHAMGMLHESSVVTRNTVQYITGALDRLKMADKGRGNTESAWLSPLLKKLSAAATLADTQMKERTKKLTDNLHTSGWVDKLQDWTFGERELPIPYGNAEARAFKIEISTVLSAVIPTAAFEEWAIDVADSWREVAKGWSQVKFD